MLTTFGSFLVIPTAASAADAAAPHPERGSMRAPAGVPSSYMFTHHGWFHPSCVVRIGEDEVVGADTVVRGRADGAAHFSLSPCAYPRFDLHGRAAPTGTAALDHLPEHLPPQAAAAPYDGYIVAYFYNGKIASGSTLVTDVIVPTPPTEVADQDVAFFNGIQTPSCIMQPVSTSTARRPTSGRSRASNAASTGTTCKPRPSWSRRATPSAARSPEPGARPRVPAPRGLSPRRTSQPANRPR